MAQDDGRVEPRTVLVGRGLGATPERIVELQERARDVEKLTRPAPSRSFSQVLTTQAQGRRAVEPVSEKQKRRQALPKKAPRPRLKHPSQRESYGREPGPDETIVLKG